MSGTQLIEDALNKTQTGTVTPSHPILTLKKNVPV